jgi:hypothetical protein
VFRRERVIRGDPHIERSVPNMPRWRVKSLKGYEGRVVLDAERILSAMKRYKHAKRRPTSVDLEKRTIRRLKIIAKEQGIPSQVVIRIFITYDLEAMKKPRDVPWN